MWWMIRTTGLIEFSALAWTAFAQQNQNPPQTVLDNPVTVAALLSLIAGALIHFVPRIATAIVNVIEALAGIVQEVQRTQQVKRDAMTQHTQEMKDRYEEIKSERARADAANDLIDVERERASKAIDASIESIKLANQATARVDMLLTEKQSEIDARLAAEKLLLAEKERVRTLELQLAAMSAWNANVIAIAKVEAEARNKPAEVTGTEAAGS